MKKNIQKFELYCFEHKATGVGKRCCVSSIVRALMKCCNICICVHFYMYFNFSEEGTLFYTTYLCHEVKQRILKIYKKVILLHRNEIRQLSKLVRNYLEAAELYVLQKNGKNTDRMSHRCKLKSVSQPGTIFTMKVSYNASLALIVHSNRVLFVIS